MEDKDKRVGWLRELKEGDKVVIRGYEKAIKKIDKITPTGRIKVGDTQYDCTGHEITSNQWHRNLLSQWTQEQENELIHQIKFQKMCNKLSEIKWNDQDYELVEKCFLLIEEKL